MSDQPNKFYFVFISIASFLFFSLHADLGPIRVGAEFSDIVAQATITQSGKYRLTRNLLITTGAGITIAADDVYVDLDNHELIGTGGTIGIDVGSTRNNITIRNGIVRSFSTNAVQIGNLASGISDNILLENIATFTCDTGFNIVNTWNIQCVNLQSFFHTSFGLLLDSVKNVIFEDCLFNFMNAITGIGVDIIANNFQPSGLTFIRCQANNSGQGFLYTADNVTFNNCESNSNSIAGFVAGGANKIVHSNCSASTNGGISFGGSGFFNVNCIDAIYDHCVSLSNIDSTPSNGFFASSTIKAIYKECVANDNFSTTTGIGFNLLSCADSCIIDCIAKKNTGVTSAGIGINLLDCVNCSVQNNFVLSNTGAIGAIGIAVRNTGGAGTVTTSILGNRAENHGSEMNFVVNPGTFLLTTFSIPANTLASDPTPHTELHNTEILS